VLVIAAFWIGPFRPLPAQLQLLALGGDGRFHEYVGIPSSWADTLPAASEATARFPLILAVHNAGAMAAQPTRLSLNMPARYRLTNKHGQPLRVHMAMGNPLVRYDLPVRTENIEPGRQPSILNGLDTLYLEPIVPSMYCTALSDSVPEFVSAPAQDPRLLSRVRVFYSFSGPAIRQRQAGLLTIQVDPNLVRRDPAPSPPIFDTQVIRPEAPKPEMHGLHFAGSRSSWCGDPGQPLEIRDALYETADGGRFFILYRGSTPQKYLFDLNRDSIIEMEMWDQDGDGKMESRRAAHLWIPSFLMPYRQASDSAVTDTLGGGEASIDTVQSTPEWLRTFYDTTGGPLRFAPSQPAGAAQPSTTAVPQPRAVVPAAPGTTTQPLRVPNVQMDSTAARVFDRTDAGALRFYRAEHGMALPKRPPAEPKQTGPKLLGVPVEEAKKVRRPTQRVDTPRVIPLPDSLRPDTGTIR
jgi:hypothetical protein